MLLKWMVRRPLVRTALVRMLAFAGEPRRNNLG